MEQVQKEIIAALGVKPEIDVEAEIEKRINFLAQAIMNASMKSYVLGISGGVDSSVSGRLAQLAVLRCREQGYDASFIAVRLPYGEQHDEEDAQRALIAIDPDWIETVNIKPATDATMNSLGMLASPREIDFVKGNVKARQRMVAQYMIAGFQKGLVIGTDHAAEALMGFYTKHGDGACDLTPLAGLNKRQVRMLGTALGLPDAVVHKVPTADLEGLNPGVPDEVALGVSYNDIDDFLEGKNIDVEVANKIIRQYNMTAHKRAMPFGPQD